MVTKWVTRTSQLIKPDSPFRDPLIDTEVVTYADHEAALREKDRTIQQIREHEYSSGLADGEALAAKEKDKEIERLHRVEHSLLERSDAAKDRYSCLMQQAIRFAVRARDWGNDAVVEEAQAFLNRPEVQAWRKEQHGTTSHS